MKSDELNKKDLEISPGKAYQSLIKSSLNKLESSPYRIKRKYSGEDETPKNTENFDE